MNRKERKALKQQYGELYTELVEIFFRTDPQGIAFDSNSDEYEPEVSTILPRIIKAESPEEIIPILKDELFKWFGSGITNPELTWDQLAGELFAAINRRRGAAV